RVGSWQSEQESRAARRCGLELERPAHLLGQVPREREAETVAAAPPGGRLGRAVELEESGGGAGVEAGARVLDLERGAGAVVAGADADGAAGRGRLDRVAEQVVEDLLDPVWIRLGPDGLSAGRAGQGQREVVLVC